MIATRRFVFLHLHKSGGTFVNEALLRYVSGARQIGYHLPHTRIPAEYAHLPVLGLVRSPWAYYVSWYAFQSAQPQPNALFRVLSRDGALGFDGTIRQMLDLGRNRTLLGQVVAALPARYTNRGLNLPGEALAPIDGTSLGFYSYLHRYLYGAPPRAEVARLERLAQELPALIERTGETVGDDLRRHLQQGAPTNVSAHAPYAGYYDATLAALVRERDADVIERYGYRFAD